MVPCWQWQNQFSHTSLQMLALCQSSQVPKGGPTHEKGLMHDEDRRCHRIFLWWIFFQRIIVWGWKHRDMSERAQHRGFSSQSQCQWWFWSCSTSSAIFSCLSQYGACAFQLIFRSYFSIFHSYSFKAKTESTLCTEWSRLPFGSTVRLQLCMPPMFPDHGF